MKKEERLTLTDWSINGQAEIYQYLSSIPQYNIRHHQTLCSCVRRTAEYEDTGLSPAEVEALKHRAEVAEEALSIACENKNTECPNALFDTTKYCRFGDTEGTEECDLSKSFLCWEEYYKQQAEQRLKEAESDNN